MDINLEKIELVKDRTGVSYNEAKEALENVDGSVVDAIVAIEEKMNEDATENNSFKDSQTFKKMKEIVEKGNISQIVIKKSGETVIKFPVTVGVVGTVLVPWLGIIAAVTALGTRCDIELIDDKGVVYDVNGKVIEICDKAKDSEAVNLAKEYIDKGVAFGKEKGEELINFGKDKLQSIIDKSK